MGAMDSGEPCCYCEHWLAEGVAMVALVELRTSLESKLYEHGLD